jgi:hypothetical protein
VVWQGEETPLLLSSIVPVFLLVKPTEKPQDKIPDVTVSLQGHSTGWGGAESASRGLDVLPTSLWHERSSGKCLRVAWRVPDKVGSRQGGFCHSGSDRIGDIWSCVFPCKPNSAGWPLPHATLEYVTPFIWPFIL